ncbi:uncharacterized protein ACNLHF_003390 isoform 2-T2 [Anomaloglossus baeobatrachus]|uniref:uncharacterized protein LOC142257848 isoform X2 n=1 Tax=Anomaloglossus baeobatrachus TaxID=238106 RepID=UPI003F4F439B
MHCSQCFWETREIGCQKTSCGFYHILPRNIQGLFIPPTTEAQVKSEIGHQMPRTVIIPLVDTDEEAEDEELDGVKREERFKTQEDDEEEKAIIAVCRSAGDFYKLSNCEDNERQEEKTPHGDFYKLSSCEDNERQEEKTPHGGDSPKHEPLIIEKKQSAPLCDKGDEEKITADYHTAPLHENGSHSGKTPPKPHDSPSKQERSTYWKGHQHFYRGDYRKDGQTWRKKFWYTDYDEYYQADRDIYDNYQPCRKPYYKGWKKTYMYEEKNIEDNKPVVHRRGNKPSNISYHQQEDHRHSDTYQPARKPTGKGWRRTYPPEEKDIGFYQFNQKKKSEEKRKVLTPRYEEEQKSRDNYYVSRRPLGRGQRKYDISWDKNTENYQPFRKPHAETHCKDKVIEKSTGHKQNLGKSPSTEKNKNFMPKSKAQLIQRQPVIRKRGQEESKSGAPRDSTCKI